MEWTRKLIAYLVPFFVMFNIHMNHFFAVGPDLHDAGWFAHLASNSVFPNMENPELIGGSFFATHISPIFWLYTVCSQAVFFLDDLTFFSVVQAAWVGGFSLVVYQLLRSHFSGWIAVALSILSAVNGIVIVSAIFPHIEFVIPIALISYFILSADRESPGWFPAIVLMLGLFVREDAGLHYALVFGTLAAYVWLRKDWSWARRYVKLAAVCFGYSLVALAIQRIWFSDEGVDLFQKLYAGEDFYSHLSPDLVGSRLHVILTHQYYLLIPLAALLVVSIYRRSLFLIIPLVAAVPWFGFQITAFSDVPGWLLLYYGFPLLISSAWAFVGATSHNIDREMVKSKGLAIAAIALFVSGLLAPSSFAQVLVTDKGVGWGFDYVESRGNLLELSESDESLASLFDVESLLGDGAAATLFPSSIEHVQEVPEWTVDLDRFDGYAFFEDSRSGIFVEQVASQRGFGQQYRYLNTPLLVALSEVPESVPSEWSEVVS